MSKTPLNRGYLIKTLTALGVLGASSLISLPVFSQSVFPSGTYAITSDTLISPTVQQIVTPGGTTTFLGFVANRNGTFTNSNGTTITSDGLVVTPNGLISTPKGAIISPNGWVSDLNSRTFTSPNGQITRLSRP
jgi:hypothetical protein